MIIKIILYATIITSIFLSSPTILGKTKTAKKSKADEYAEKYVNSVKHFADTVLEKGRDTYGEKKTPLFVDGLQVETMEPTIWKWVNGEEWVMCNYASQQPLMRLLDGLTTLTGEEKYRKAAEDATRYMLENCTSKTGFLYWGGHTLWDLKADEPCGTFKGREINGIKKFNHELKSHQPYYDIMYRVNPEAAKTVMESIWSGHILDWQRLDYNRHAKTWKKVRPQWGAEFNDKIKVPYPAVGGNLSFCNVVPPFIHTGVKLNELAGEKKALLWTRRLAYRWQEARDPKTKLCGGQVSYREHDRAQDALGHVHPNINEAQIVGSYHQTTRYHRLPLAELQAADRMLKQGGEAEKLGKDFLQWASDDLKVYCQNCYNPETNRFDAKLINGTTLKWQDCKGQDYYIADVFAPCRPDGWLFWGLAMAYRMTKDPAHWEMLKNIAPEFGLSGFGSPDGKKQKRKLEFKKDGARIDWRAIYALIELSNATHDRRFLGTATKIADILLTYQKPTGMFIRPAKKYPEQGSGEQIHHAIDPGRTYPESKYGRTGDEIPLALLHLAAAIKKKDAELPQAIMDDRYLHCPYKGQLAKYQRKRLDNRTYDWLVFFGED